MQIMHSNAMNDGSRTLNTMADGTRRRRGMVCDVGIHSSTPPLLHSSTPQLLTLNVLHHWKGTNPLHWLKRHSSSHWALPRVSTFVRPFGSCHGDIIVQTVWESHYLPYVRLHGKFQELISLLSLHAFSQSGEVGMDLMRECLAHDAEEREGSK